VATSGAGAVETNMTLTAEARYENQVWDIDVPVPCGRLDAPEDVAAFRSAFDDAHEAIFTIRDAGSSVEIVGLRAMVRCRMREQPSFRLATAAAKGKRPPVRPAFFAKEGWTESAIYHLEALAVDEVHAGPAIVESDFTSVVVDPGASFRRAASGSLIINP